MGGKFTCPVHRPTCCADLHYASMLDPRKRAVSQSAVATKQRKAAPLCTSAFSSVGSWSGANDAAVGKVGFGGTL